VELPSTKRLTFLHQKRMSLSHLLLNKLGVPLRHRRSKQERRPQNGALQGAAYLWDASSSHSFCFPMLSCGRDGVEEEARMSG
jgi:hypothetical protein